MDYKKNIVSLGTLNFQVYKFFLLDVKSLKFWKVLLLW